MKTSKSPAWARHSPLKRAFTLTELLVVIAIIAVLSSASIASFASIEQGVSIRSACDTIDAQLELARTDAIASNKTTVFRMYQYGDTSVGENPSTPSAGKFRAVQLFQVNSDGSTQPLEPVVRLPKAAYIASSSTLSNLIGSASTSASPLSSNGTMLNVSIPGMGLNYNCVSIQFFPDGSTDLSSASAPWFLTVVNLHDQLVASGTPKNFSTLQIQTSNGNVQIYRP